MKKLLIIAIILTTTPSFAQQAADPAFLQRAVIALQAQRNAALDAAAVEQARANGLTDDLAKANARVKELEAAATPKAEPEPKK